ncbi:MAG TPA: aldo/keto reductase, partial [Cyclobacteriaceae bacterium]|nr:aldo/keto reductase [Cyclobacteriaceae bacterium]
MTRREYLRTLSGLGLAMGIQAWNFKDDPLLLQRSIPSTGEMLPAVGVGTWRTFDVGESETEQAPLLEVLENLIKRGGKVVDSSPMYGNSEKVVGDLSTRAHLNDKLFIATKVWTSGEQSGIRQMNESFTFLKRKQIDL